MDLLIETESEAIATTTTTTTTIPDVPAVVRKKLQLTTRRYSNAISMEEQIKQKYQNATTNGSIGSNLSLDSVYNDIDTDNNSNIIDTDDNSAVQSDVYDLVLHNEQMNLVVDNVLKLVNTSNEDLVYSDMEMETSDELSNEYHYSIGQEYTDIESPVFKKKNIKTKIDNDIEPVSTGSYKDCASDVASTPTSVVDWPHEPQEPQQQEHVLGLLSTMIYNHNATTATDDAAAAIVSAENDFQNYTFPINFDEKEDDRPFDDYSEEYHTHLDRSTCDRSPRHDEVTTSITKMSRDNDVDEGSHTTLSTYHRPGHHTHNGKKVHDDYYYSNHSSSTSSSVRRRLHFLADEDILIDDSTPTTSTPYGDDYFDIDDMTTSGIRNVLSGFVKRIYGGEDDQYVHSYETTADRDDGTSHVVAAKGTSGDDDDDDDGDNNTVVGRISEVQDHVASKMDVVLALDKLDSIQRELRSTRMHLLERNDMIHQLRSMLQQKTSQMGSLRLERDLFRADIESMKHSSTTTTATPGIMSSSDDVVNDDDYNVSSHKKKIRNSKSRTKSNDETVKIKKKKKKRPVAEKESTIDSPTIRLTEIAAASSTIVAMTLATGRDDAINVDDDSLLDTANSPRNRYSDDSNTVSIGNDTSSHAILDPTSIASSSLSTSTTSRLPLMTLTSALSSSSLFFQQNQAAHFYDSEYNEDINEIGSNGTIIFETDNESTASKANKSIEVMNAISNGPNMQCFTENSISDTTGTDDICASANKNINVPVLQRTVTNAKGLTGILNSEKNLQASSRSGQFSEIDSVFSEFSFGEFMFGSTAGRLSSMKSIGNEDGMTCYDDVSASLKNDDVHALDLLNQNVVAVAKDSTLVAGIDNGSTGSHAFHDTDHDTAKTPSPPPTVASGISGPESKQHSPMTLEKFTKFYKYRHSHRATNPQRDRKSFFRQPRGIRNFASGQHSRHRHLFQSSRLLCDSPSASSRSSNSSARRSLPVLDAGDQSDSSSDNKSVDQPLLQFVPLLSKSISPGSYNTNQKNDSTSSSSKDSRSRDNNNTIRSKERTFALNANSPSRLLCFCRSNSQRKAVAVAETQATDTNHRTLDQVGLDQYSFFSRERSLSESSTSPSAMSAAGRNLSVSANRGKLHATNDSTYSDSIAIRYRIDTLATHFKSVIDELENKMLLMQHQYAEQINTIDDSAKKSIDQLRTKIQQQEKEMEFMRSLS